MTTVTDEMVERAARLDHESGAVTVRTPTEAEIARTICCGAFCKERDDTRYVTKICYAHTWTDEAKRVLALFAAAPSADQQPKEEPSEVTIRRDRDAWPDQQAAQQPDIRAQVIEECARAVESRCSVAIGTGSTIVAAGVIRALATKST